MLKFILGIAQKVSLIVTLLKDGSFLQWHCPLLSALGHFLTPGQPTYCLKTAGPHPTHILSFIQPCRGLRQVWLQLLPELLPLPVQPLFPVATELTSVWLLRVLVELKKVFCSEHSQSSLSEELRSGPCL